MRELSLHILDIVQNSIAAGAFVVTISVTEQRSADKLTIAVTDDGRGMSKELAAAVVDPFTTTRTTRKVGLGIPMMKAGAQRCGGGLVLWSEPGKGTTLTATYQLTNIDRPPMGDLAGTMLALVAANPDSPDFVLHYCTESGEYAFDTREIRRVLGGVPLTAPEVLDWMQSNLKEGIQEIHGGA